MAKYLTALDAELDAIYQHKLAADGNPDTLRQTQRNWIHYQRDTCQDRDCVLQAYTKRKALLLSGGD